MFEDAGKTPLHPFCFYMFMRMKNLLQTLSQPVCDIENMTDSEKLNWLIRRALKEDSRKVPWIARKDYAKINGVTSVTVYKHTNRLRKIGAAEGEGRATRYNPLVTIDGSFRT
jgi:hypothetical protein